MRDLREQLGVRMTHWAMPCARNAGVWANALRG
jgi:hypothetical protein